MDDASTTSAQTTASRVAIELARASGVRLARGRLLVPTGRLVWLILRALGSVKVVESLDVVPGDGDARLHLTVRAMGEVARVVVHASVASLHLERGGGALCLRLLGAPTFAVPAGARGAGALRVLGAFGEAAFTSMGPEGILQAVVDLLGPPLSARRDLLTIDLGAIAAVQQLLARRTPVGALGDLVNVRGARFQPAGLEVALAMRPRAALAALRAHAFGQATAR